MLTEAWSLLIGGCALIVVAFNVARRMTVQQPAPARTTRLESETDTRTRRRPAVPMGPP